jgi:CheY-like chemotaxis protein/HD-like signal output (HDOD) protein
MSTLLIVDDTAVFREPIAASLSRAGYETMTARNGQEALDKIKAKLPDLILLDMAMPVMDGLSFLKHLRGMDEAGRTKVILLTADGAQDTVLKAASLGVRDYMLKSTFSLKELLVRVKRSLEGPAHAATVNAPVVPTPAPQPAAPPARAYTQAPPPAPCAVPSAKCPPADRSKLILLTRDQTRQRLLEIMQTRTCAGVVAQVMGLANSPNSEINDLVRVIETDPIMASRVLHLANSAMFRQKFNRLATIDDAVRKVGMRAIQNAVLSIGIFLAFPPDEKDGFNSMRCWQHSFAVAAILRRLMEQRNEADRERVALVGLCHDLGEIVLRQHFAAEYEKILECALRTGQPVANVEGVALSMRHSELVSEVLTRIGLPPNIAIPIMRHHDVRAGGSAGGGGEELEVSRLLQIANWLAHGMLLAASLEAEISPVTKADLKRACGTDQVAIEPAALRGEVLTATNVLARLPANEEARFLKPLQTRRQTRVWYARHASYANLDPVSVALGLLAETRGEGRLPHEPAEIEGTDLILVASPFLESGPAMLNEIRAIQKIAGYRGQPFLILLENAAGAPIVANTQMATLPVPIKVLSNAIEAASQVMAATGA